MRGYRMRGYPSSSLRPAQNPVKWFFEICGRILPFLPFWLLYTPQL
jgi:hypothetical protein